MVYVDEKRVEGGSDGGGRRGAQERQGTRHEHGDQGEGRLTGSGRSGGLADAGKKGFQASVGKAIYEDGARTRSRMRRPRCSEERGEEKRARLGGRAGRVKY